MAAEPAGGRDEPLPFHRGCFSLSGRRDRRSYFQALTVLLLSLLAFSYAFVVIANPILKEYDALWGDPTREGGLATMYKTAAVAAVFLAVFAVASHISMAVLAQRLRHAGLPGWPALLLLPLGASIWLLEFIHYIAIAYLALLACPGLIPGKAEPLLDLSGPDGQGQSDPEGLLPFSGGWLLPHGRRSRASFLLAAFVSGMSGLILAGILLRIDPLILGLDPGPSGFGGVVNLLVAAICALMFAIILALCAQRLRHIGLPGYLAVFAVPLVGYLLVSDDTLNLAPLIYGAIAAAGLFLLLAPGRLLDLDED